MSEYYVVLLDKDKDFCRLYRTDSEDRPAGEPLWEGKHLRSGYDAMIRLNKERRPIPTYHVVQRQNDKGHMAYRYCRDVVAEGWALVETFYDLASAKALLSEKIKERAAKRKRTLALLKRAGVDRGRIPPLTQKDKAYLDWLVETGRFEEIAA